MTLCMRAGLAVVAGIGLGMAALAAPAFAGPARQDADLGARVYEERCSFCHGVEGDGNGEVADDLLPRPRDFTRAFFKIKTTDPDTLPSDADLIRTVALGLPGTAMPAWEGTLTADEIAAVVEHLKTFAPDDWADEDLAPLPLDIGSPPAVTDELIAEGREIFAGETAGCFNCHGAEGRGDGDSAEGMTDDWDQPIVPANLTKGWRYLGGHAIEDVYARLTTGMFGSPMPSFGNSLNDEQRWAVAAYVSSLARTLPEDTVLTAQRHAGTLPSAPADAAWDAAPELLLPLAGQVVFPPRWQNPSVDAVSVQALYNDTDIAFRLTWDDRFHDTDDAGRPPSLPAATDTYVRPVAEYLAERHPYVDRIELQFPSALPEGPELPYFVGGSPTLPVTLWRWQASAADEVTVLSRSGPQVGAEERPDTGGVAAAGAFDAGRYTAVFTRARQPAGGADITFPEGVPVPFALHAWDGARGETSWVDADGVAHDMMSISAWYHVVLKPETTPMVYGWSLIAAALVAGGEWFVARRLRGRRRTESV